ncbi:F-box/FBD/LRR-repeat protein At2g26030-like [Henckelia pumila]|uniref:F-box/FBD/LRR-repeat protein At2g26030-like n=1 Tax=Henckelia pumila TaxID=405737 RepID=UPI003C6E5D52
MDGSIQSDRNADYKLKAAGMGDEEKHADKKARADVDIISNMPESIISKILSLLPTKDVLRTSVLSKDWEYKWTGIYNIDINDMDRILLKSTRKTSVANCVDRIFILSRNSSLTRFCLSFRHKYDTRRMITWISAALMRNVQELDIIYNHEGVVVPRCLFDCTRLTTLKLQLPCVFRPVQDWSSNLKVLNLAQVEIVNEHAPCTRRLVFRFLVLETFGLDRCKWVNVDFVEIHAPSLTKLYVEKHSDPQPDSFRIKICRAKLERFDFRGSFLERFDLSSSSLLCASIDFLGFALDLEATRKNGLNARLLLKECSGLTHILLSGSMLQAIILSKQGPSLPKFNTVKQLDIFTRGSSELLLEFLRSTPSLERIRLNMGLWEDYDYGLVEYIPPCIVSRLNDVHFNGFKGEQPQVRLAEFLLKNAQGLKKMSGLLRKKSQEQHAEMDFWTSLKRVFGDGGFAVSSSRRTVTTVADFERCFGI